jgi:hypothetical protein
MWDLSLPGYKYLGPFNKLNKGTPTNYNDLIAYIHDIEYGKIIERGGNPYLQWSEADAKAYRKFTMQDYGGAAAKIFFGLKKKAYDVGLIPKFDEFEPMAPSDKRFRFTKMKATELKLRMDAPFGMIDSTLNSTNTSGLNVNMVRSSTGSLGLSTGSEENFPEKLAVADNLLIPFWFNYFAKLYEYYTVIGCSYEIYIQNAQRDSAGHVLGFHRFESEGESGTTASIPANASLYELKTYDGLEWFKLFPMNNQNGQPYAKLIKGYYQRGDARRNVRNDQDVKTWSRTDGSKPALKERMHLGIIEDPFSTLGDAECGVNLQITLRYRVQFKDLVQQAKYPSTTIESEVITDFPNDIVQVLDPL